MNTAKITNVSRIGQSETLEVQVTFSDGTNKQYTCSVDSTKDEIKSQIKADIARLNSIDGKVANLQELVGKEIN